MKKNYLIFLLCAVTLTAFSQRNGSTNYLPNFVPPSPEASSLGQYVDHPVGHYTGIPQINIPLFEISSGRINVPISLNYHASGIKIEQIASRVGLGWTLNAGGLITRSLAGYMDDLDLNYGGRHYYGYFNLPTNYSVTSTDPDGDVYDSEPDPHYYNIPGHSGKFYFENRLDYIITDREDIKINSPYYDGGNFEIKTNDGLIYRFDAIEVTNITGGCSAFGGGLGGYAYYSSWYLTEIIDVVSGKTVTFTYTTTGNIVNSTTTNKQFASNSCFGYNPNSSCTNSNTTSNVKILSRIDYDDGYMIFEINDREDLNNDKKYTSIKKYNSSGDLEKGYSFNYIYNHINGDVSEKAKRLYLQKINEISSSGSEEQRYAFGYITPNLLPPRDSYEQDIWGYFNGNGATNLQPNIYEDTYNFGKIRYSIFNGGGKTLIHSGFSRESNSSKIGIGTLNKITYPTGGYSTYTYELHQFGSISGAGIRVKDIMDYESDGTFLTKTSYTYSGGKIPGAIPQAAIPNGTGVMIFYRNRSYLGSNNGGYVGYDNVTERKIDLNGNTTGRIYYQFMNEPDTPPTYSLSQDCDYMNKFSYYPFFSWQSNEIERGVLKKKSFYYSYDDQSVPPAKVIEYKYKRISIDPIESKTIRMGAAIGSLKFEATRKIVAEKMLLTSQVEKEYDNNGNVFAKTIGYSYNDLYGQDDPQEDYNRNLAIRTRWESTGQSYLKTEYKYPYDFASTASGGVMGKMVDMHYVSPVIQELNWTSYNGTYKLTSAKVTNYKEFGTSPNIKILPDKVFATELSTPLASVTDITNPANPGSLYKKRMEFVEYTGEKPKLIIYDDHIQRLTWWSSKLMASEIIPTSGTFTFMYPPQGYSEVASSTAKTGDKVYRYNANSSFPNFNMSRQGTYYVSFWAKGGTWSFYGSEEGHSSGTAPAEWTRVSKVFKDDGNDWWEGLLYMQGSADIDELRISYRPVQITTYHYDKFNRLTEISDPANTVTHFRYDAFGRLIYTSDTNEDITEAFYYNFK